MAKRISEAETETAIVRIRKKYNDLIVSYMLDPRIKEGFEKRLLEIRKRGFDIARFLGDEITSILEIEKAEKEKINNAAKKNSSVKEKREKDKETGEKDFADRVIEQMMAKIEKYPGISIHQNANPEICKLFGALSEFDISMWPVYDKLAKKYRVNRYDPVYTRLEAMLNNFTRIYTEDVPVRLVRYRSMLDSSFSRNSEIGKEEKLCILECAFIVKALKDVISDLMKNPEILQNEKEKLQGLNNYLDQLTNDFRLKDLMTLGK